MFNNIRTNPFLTLFYVRQDNLSVIFTIQIILRGCFRKKLQVYRNLAEINACVEQHALGHGWCGQNHKPRIALALPEQDLPYMHHQVATTRVSSEPGHSIPRN